MGLTGSSSNFFGERGTYLEKFGPRTTLVRAGYSLCTSLLCLVQNVNVKT